MVSLSLGYIHRSGLLVSMINESLFLKNYSPVFCSRQTDPPLILVIIIVCYDGSHPSCVMLPLMRSPTIYILFWRAFAHFEHEFYLFWILISYRIYNL